MLVTQRLPAPIGGVSQAPAELRDPSQLAEAINTFPSDTLGLGVRRGTQTVSPLSTPSVAGEHAIEYAPAPGERYLFRITSAGISLIDVLTGQERTVTTTGDLAAFLAAGKFASAVVGNAAYVVSKGYSRTQWTNRLAPTQQNAVLVAVKQGAPSTQYKIVLDGVPIAVRTPDDPPPATKRPAIGLVVDASPASTGNTGGSSLGLAIAPLSTTVAPGGNRTISCAISRGGGFTGDVVMSLVNPAAGFTGTFTPNPALSTDTSAGLILHVDSSVPDGTYYIPIRATDSVSGILTSTQTIQVFVVSGTPTNPGGGGSDPGGGPIDGLSLAVSGAPLTLQQGASGSLPVTLGRLDGNTASVTLAGQVVPDGFSVAFGTNPLNTAATASTVTVAAAANVIPGTYSVTIRASALGYHDVFTAFSVVVSAATGGGSTQSMGISASPAEITVPAGSINTTSIVTTRTGGYADLIGLSVLSVPDGIHASLSNTSLGVGTESAVLTVSVDAGVLPSGYQVVVHATASVNSSIQSVNTTVQIQVP